MKKEIILIGGGGHCKSVIDVIEAENRFKIAGIVDLKEKLGEKILGYEIIGTDGDLEKLCKTYEYFFITIGHIYQNKIRKKLFEKVKNLGGKFPVIVSPNAYVSKHSKIDEGTIIMHKAFVNANAEIGKNNIINTAAIVEHDVKIGNHCHVSTGAFLNGEVKLANNCLIGSQASIIQNVKIAESNIIGAGAVVLKNTDKNALYAGNPAKLKKLIHE